MGSIAVREGVKVGVFEDVSEGVGVNVSVGVDVLEDVGEVVGTDGSVGVGARVSVGANNPMERQLKSISNNTMEITTNLCGVMMIILG